MNLIPGSGEFGLATEIVRRWNGPGQETAENANSAEARADFLVSLDQLESDLPAAKRVNLVVAWFGDDLRCGECRIRPGVELADKPTRPWEWSVANRVRADAHVISQIGGRPAYGGTPADLAVRQAIRELKARGFSVTLYPFVLMDVPAGNSKADPAGAAEQPVYPWRGRITVTPAPGRSGSPDGSAAAAAQIATFFDGDEGYAAFIRHYASIAAEEAADGLLIGSELVGLTAVRDGDGGYPAVAKLRALAAQVRAIAGPAVEISYGADWTEYGAHVRADGEVAFPLDALWADDAITYVGLDWYAPMADWRDGFDHLDAHWEDGRSRDYLAANIAGGEAFDWFYADAAGRAAQARLPITDGAYAEPWVFRKKDIASWWSNAHHPRRAGVRDAAATAWTPRMKPVRFVEMGCPAVDRGANQPNVFFDPKSSESALPHFSSGARDDLIQRRAIEAFAATWRADPANMVPADGVAVWAWDARPFPAWPGRADVWGDADNWRLGHWLNGRAGVALLSDTVTDICSRAGASIDASASAGVIAGYQFDGPVPARRALEPLVAAFGLCVAEQETGLRVAPTARNGLVVEPQNLATESASDVGVDRRRSALDAPSPAIRLTYIDAEADHAPATVATLGAGPDASTVELPLLMDRVQAQALVDALAADMQAGRETLNVRLGPEGLAVDLGDALGVAGAEGDFVVASTSAANGLVHVEARGAAARPDVFASPSPKADRTAVIASQPDVVIVDAPPLPGEEDDVRPLAFVYVRPWTGRITLAAGMDASDLSVRGVATVASALGRLTTPLPPGAVSGIWSGASTTVSLPGALLASRADGAVLNGANLAVVETSAGWELIQFAQAELIGSDQWRLSRLLRGQQGSEVAMSMGAGIGARFALVEGGVRLDMADRERGLEFLWVAYRERYDEPTAWKAAFAMGGRAARPWSPAHLSALSSDSGICVSWVRRGAKGGDAWDADPVLVGPERYRLSVVAGDAPIRQIETSAATWLYSTADMALDAAIARAVRIEVAELGYDGVAGDASAISVNLP